MTDFKKGLMVKGRQNDFSRDDRDQSFSRGLAVVDGKQGPDPQMAEEKMAGKMRPPKDSYLKSVSVTTVLSVFSNFDSIPERILENACKRGTRVHSACCAYSRGVYCIPPPLEWHGYFRSFQYWFDQYVTKVFFAEQRFYDEDLGFNGMPDLGVELMPGFDFNRVIIDLKTPATEYPTWRAQTAAYLHLANKQYGPNFFDGHMALRLKSDGKMAKALPYKNQVRDFTAFMSALNAWRYFKL